MNDSEAPLAERMRPKQVEDMVGQIHLLGSESTLYRAIKSDRIFSVIFWGPPGSGKTTLAKLIGQYSQSPFRTFSAVTSGVKDLRSVIAEAKETFQLTKKKTILFVDEIHRFNRAQQDAFLPYVESGLIALVGATTQNPSFEIIPPLLSRTRVMVLKPLEREDLQEILSRAVRDGEKGLGSFDIEVQPEAREHIIDVSGGDARVALNNLEIAVHYVLEGNYEQKVLDSEKVEEAIGKRMLTHDKAGEEHFNLISAFHKSLRGGDIQASLYWLYRMLIAGEEPLFIGRRMIRFASEDIGLADPNALQVTVAAFEAWEKVGPPEAELALAEAAAYLAAAPKSNALYLADRALKKEIESSGAQPVPLHIRNAPTGLMKRLGYSRGYLYPHNYPGGWVHQEYLPDHLKNRIYYRPTGRGFEKEIRRSITRNDTKGKK